MLLRFGVKNHLSIRDYQELSCVASGGYDDLDHTFSVAGLRPKEKEVLPVIAVYGANAAGKSNILDALSFFDWAIRRSHIEWDERPDLPHKFFALDSQSKDTESIYDCDVIIDGVRYQYGFAMNSAMILKEWLYSYPKGTRSILFQRDFTSDNEMEIYFGPSLKRISSVWKALANNSKTLLLSAAGKKEHFHDQLTPVFDYFRRGLTSVKLKDEDLEIRLAHQIRDDNIRSRLADALRMADFGITAIELESVPVPDEAKEFMGGLYALIRKQLPESDSNEPIPTPPNEQMRINFRHTGCDGKTYLVKYDDESSGTRYLMNLMVPVISALENGNTLIVDEITTNLHTKLSEKIIGLFTSRETNRKNAQFIFSTHDTNLLSRELLRRDEIWFAEKDTEGATSIYPLSDFKTRKADNIEKGYLQGRFGAIPFMGDIGALLRLD